MLKTDQFKILANRFGEHTGSMILDNICGVFECERSTIINIEPLEEGLTNLSFLFDIEGTTYVYRHPGNGTEEVVNRQAEEYSLRIAKKLGLDETFVFEDPHAGWKISQFIHGCEPFDYMNDDHVKKALGLARRLHESGETSPWNFDAYEESAKIIKILESASYPLPADFAQLSLLIDEIASFIKDEQTEPVLCHNDFYGPNFLVKPDGELCLIDWEYSAMSDYANDIGNFVSQGSGYDVDQAIAVLDHYFGREATEDEVRHCLAYIALVGFYWYVWAMFKDLQGNPVGEWIDIWHDSAWTFGTYVLDMLGDPLANHQAVELSEEKFDELVAKYEAGEATNTDLALLEPYRAKRAVLFASGFGSRMMPITINTPKPLVRVNGKRIICSILDALLDIGVRDIVIVRGYLKDEFDILLKDYPMIRFVDNPIYDVTNNISSAVAAGDSFRNAYVFESDLYLKNPEIIKRYQYCSNYLGVPVEETQDWCFDVKDGVITDLHKGGTECFHMYGISYWDAKDGAKLPQALASAFEDEANKQRFWDDVPCVVAGDDFDIRIRPCTFDDIDEIDSFAELCEIDPSYKI